MRQYYEYKEEEKLTFAREATKYFEDHPEAITYGKDGPQKGEFYALRWGMSMNGVLIFKIDEYEEIVNYCEFIDRAKAKQCENLFNAMKDSL